MAPSFLQEQASLQQWQFGHRYPKGVQTAPVAAHQAG